MRKEKSGGKERVILHTHPVTLAAMCHALELDSRKLTHLLWSMHPEGVCLFPGGIAYLPFAIPGSEEISRQTCQASSMVAAGIPLPCRSCSIRRLLRLSS